MGFKRNKEDEASRRNSNEMSKKTHGEMNSKNTIIKYSSLLCDVLFGVAALLSVYVSLLLSSLPFANCQSSGAGKHFVR